MKRAKKSSNSTKELEHCKRPLTSPWYNKKFSRISKLQSLLCIQTFFFFCLFFPLLSIWESLKSDCQKKGWKLCSWKKKVFWNLKTTWNPTLFSRVSVTPNLFLDIFYKIQWPRVENLLTFQSYARHAGWIQSFYKMRMMNGPLQQKFLSSKVSEIARFSHKLCCKMNVQEIKTPLYECFSTI